MEKIGQVRLGNYVIDVAHEDDRVTFFSVAEKPAPNRTHFLMWKLGGGFTTRLVKEDPRSDLEIVKPLSPEEFPWADVLRLIHEHPETLQKNQYVRLLGLEPEPLPRDLADQLIAILEQGQ